MDSLLLLVLALGRHYLALELDSLIEKRSNAAITRRSATRMYSDVLLLARTSTKPSMHPVGPSLMKEKSLHNRTKRPLVILSCL